MRLFIKDLYLREKNSPQLGSWILNLTTAIVLVSAVGTYVFHKDPITTAFWVTFSLSAMLFAGLGSREQRPATFYGFWGVFATFAFVAGVFEKPAAGDFVQGFALASAAIATVASVSHAKDKVSFGYALKEVIPCVFASAVTAVGIFEWQYAWPTLVVAVPLLVVSTLVAQYAATHGDVLSKPGTEEEAYTLSPEETETARLYWRDYARLGARKIAKRVTGKATPSRVAAISVLKDTPADAVTFTDEQKVEIAIDRRNRLSWKEIAAKLKLPEWPGAKNAILGIPAAAPEPKPVKVKAPAEEKPFAFSAKEVKRVAQIKLDEAELVDESGKTPTIEGTPEEIRMRQAKAIASSMELPETDDVLKAILAVATAPALPVQLRRGDENRVAIKKRELLEAGKKVSSLQIAQELKLPQKKSMLVAIDGVQPAEPTPAPQDSQDSWKRTEDLFAGEPVEIEPKSPNWFQRNIMARFSKSEVEYVTVGPEAPEEPATTGGEPARAAHG